ncbi:hypothetical protein IMZ08_00380 [Bacillus luteolus]|uniref:HlyD family secretion protein n=1 Tax=Litchfieldia luteola TaxID=682179 RepID=A0ABR9QDL6_9BACI|nr:hypothetical protein [Cytobacillus luteolus]MBE4906511.1 hypothetical protein [Cytobacillus luteolus]MBP1941194.1 hypothetical protein [Cytobacillus luteolus]
MRKYWKTTAIIAVIVLSLGTFYVNSAWSEEQFPEFEIQTVSGNPEEIESLVLEGSYTDMSYMNYVSSNVKISAEGSVYNSRSFLNQVIGSYQMVIKELQEEYRSFMRGKSTWVESYFENDQVLAYAMVEDVGPLRSRDFSFEISVLNKGNNKINSFMVKVPDSKELNYIHVEDVQIIEDDLILITRNNMKSNHNSYGEHYLYTIDLENQKISHKESILQFTKSQDNTYTYAQLIESSPTQANENLIFQITEEKITEDMESTRVEEATHEIVSFNLLSKEKETLNISDLSLNQTQLSSFDGTLYHTSIDGQELVVTPYHLGENQADKAFRIQLPSVIGPIYQPIVTVKDGKFYAASSQMNADGNMFVIVADVSTGEKLFSGQVVFKDSLNEKVKFEIYLHQLFVK